MNSEKTSLYIKDSQIVSLEFLKFLNFHHHIIGTRMVLLRRRTFSSSCFSMSVLYPFKNKRN